ncbi:hypothetical protein [Vibrio crassostreae]|uniref:hypothetical protein n=1 Tax=Vibrio crassostreae TaxID=246167 RepID=UPI001B30B059|nr:hypothetical protein [Vibrio crassostreae]
MSTKDTVMGKKGYIATAELDEETITHYGEGATQDEAFKNFDISEYKNAWDLESADITEVGVFEAIYKGDPKWDSKMMSDDWEWALGERVRTIEIDGNNVILVK